MLISIFLSPAKALDLEPLNNKQKKLLQNFEAISGFKFQESQWLVHYLCQKKPEELAELLEISSDLAHLNYERYQKYWQANDDFSAQKNIIQDMKPAAFTFNGDAYQHLDIHSLKLASLSYLQQYLWIFSGLYGFLHAFDYIKPYRIDMGTSIHLEIDDGKQPAQVFKNLYQIWQPILVNKWFELYLQPKIAKSDLEKAALKVSNHSKKVNRSVDDMGDMDDVDGISKNISTDLFKNILDESKHQPWLLNLASQEYAKAFSLKDLSTKNQNFLKKQNINIKRVDIDFKQRKKDGSFASIGIKNKQARGAFLRYMAENQITEMADCCNFNEEGYVFSPEQSKYSESLISLVFLQSA